MGRSLEVWEANEEQRSSAYREPSGSIISGLHVVETDAVGPEKKERRERGGSGTRQRGTYQHAILAVLVQEQHARFWSYWDRLLRGRPVVCVEDSLPTNTPFGGRGQVEKKSPCGLGGDILR